MFERAPGFLRVADCRARRVCLAWFRRPQLIFGRGLFLSKINADSGVQPPARKYSYFVLAQISCLSRPSRPGRGTYRDRHGRWAWDAVDADALLTNGADADGEVVWS
jgi:hypothetical protein